MMHGDQRLADMRLDARPVLTCGPGEVSVLCSGANAGAASRLRATSKPFTSTSILRCARKLKSMTGGSRGLALASVTLPRLKGRRLTKMMP